ncbi:hypothetical protein [Streptomyces sp. NRRL S-37]|uniref:hypothetical protein n=1 Tax=Streptomyces sp. NRRL S-37 TaxID=1463903 RepID=UPI0004CA30F3|nr:hypothetical protein [Streptomyces sp. NRRL S-37]
MAGTSSAIVAGLTAAALATIGYLGHQAAVTAPAGPHRPAPGTAAAVQKALRGNGHPAALPARSGTGERVVYALGRDRVWLVEESGRVRRTYGVSPSTVDPEPGTYRVTSRSAAVTGSDGVPVEHVVRFASVEGTAIGFSAAVDGSAPRLDPEQRTGGIRETRADGEAMWGFATIGRKVVVVR